MKIVITAKELIEMHFWESFCNARGINVWSVNEGMDVNTEYILTKKEAKLYGLV